MIALFKAFILKIDIAIGLLIYINFIFHIYFCSLNNIYVESIFKFISNIIFVKYKDGQI